MYHYIKSFAKLNLNLSVSTLVEQNKLHRISSIFQTISFSDELFIRSIPSKQLEIYSNDMLYPCDEKNLLFNVYHSLKDCIPVGLEIFVKKNIPMGSGLGGGSSQAASLLNYLNSVFDLKLSTNKLMSYAASYGSDVPFFLNGGQSLVQGFGEDISPCQKFKKYACFLLLLPSFTLSTKDVFAVFDELKLGAQFKSAHLCCIGENDLLKAVLSLKPSVQNIMDICHTLGVDIYLSGSGSTFFIPFYSLSAAQNMFKKLSDYPHLFTLQLAFPVNKGFSYI